MKIGYLGVGQPQYSAPSDRHFAQDRAHLARSFGFTEFYIPGNDVQALEYSGGHELMSELILLDDPSPTSPPPTTRLTYRGADTKLFSGNRLSRNRFSRNQLSRSQLSCGRHSSSPIRPLVSTQLVRSHSQLGRLVMSVSWLNCEQIACHWQAKVIGNTHAAMPARPKDWRIARSILICADAAQAENAVMASDSPCREYYHKVAPHLSSAQIDNLLDQTVLRGTVEQVAEQLQTFKANVGEFGTLCLVDHQWPDAAMARRSISLLANLVKPAVLENTNTTNLRLALA